MSKTPALFDSDVSEDEQEDININFGNKYAKQYNDWRRKEEMQRLKDKYGDNLDIMSEIEDESGDERDDDDDDDSESESSNVESEDEDFDQQFATVLSALKSKDPKIYDKNFRVQKDEPKNGQEAGKDGQSSKSKKETSKTMTLPEYHKKLLKEKKGITEEDEGLLDDHYDDDHKPDGYYQELSNIRKEINDIAQNDDDDDEEDNMFSVKGQQLPSTSTAKPKQEIDMATIWNTKKKLDKGDAFLRDYIVNKRYTESADDQSKVKKFQEPSSHFGGFENYEEEELGEEEDEEEKKKREEDSEKTISAKATEGVKVSKYHFEEPDAAQLKRFPRNVQSVRDTIAKDTKTKRAEVREKKKEEKNAELKKMRRFKREELESKISKLKDISGNKKLDIKDLDLNVIIDDDNDFDLEKYDEKMNALFGNDYYNIEDDGDEKPEFGYCEGIDDDLYPDEEEMPQCIKKNDKKWKKKKDSKKMDIMKDDDIGIYEDLIGGDIATRFRYRMVETNDFGLTDEEILFADEKELNRWCSLKKMSQYRSKQEEDHDKFSFDKKKDNMELKTRILKSLYGEESVENPIIKAFGKHAGREASRFTEEVIEGDNDNEGNEEAAEKNAPAEQEEKKKKKKKRGKKKKNPDASAAGEETGKDVEEEPEEDKEEMKEAQVEVTEAKVVSKEAKVVAKEPKVEVKEAKSPQKAPQPQQQGSKQQGRKRKRNQNNKNNNQNNKNQNANYYNKDNVGNSGLNEARLKAYGMSKREIKRVKL